MGGYTPKLIQNANGSIDRRSVEWDRVIAANYHIAQSLRYEYSQPISNLHNRLIIAPRRLHLDQQRIANHLWTAAIGPIPLEHDEFGNDVADVDVARVEHEIVFSLESSIVRDKRFNVAAATAYDLVDPRWTGSSRLTRPNDAIAASAKSLRSHYPNQRELAYAIVEFVSKHLTYTKRVTDVFTTAATAFAQRRGVCQDYAHIAISIARCAGLSARYVSGHLLGEGATHAWIEMLVDDRNAGPTILSLDPTHNKATNFSYVVVAIGRDYDDVPPTSGWFNGDGAGKLHGRQTVQLTGITYAA